MRMAAFSCAWVWRSGRGGLQEQFFDVGAVASALLRQSRDTAEALSKEYLVGSCALSECRAQSLEILQYSLHCHPRVYITPHENCYHSTKDCVENFQHDYVNDDSSKKYELEKDRCKYYSIFDGDNGEIQLEITHQSIACYVMLSYFDNANQEKLRKQIMDDL